jgi:hypothetical protein
VHSSQRSQRGRCFGVAVGVGSRCGWRRWRNGSSAPASSANAQPVKQKREKNGSSEPGHGSTLEAQGDHSIAIGGVRGSAIVTGNQKKRDQSPTMTVMGILLEGEALRFRPIGNGPQRRYFSGSGLFSKQVVRPAERTDPCRSHKPHRWPQPRCPGESDAWLLRAMHLG